jgi:hypothetical protein
MTTWKTSYSDALMALEMDLELKEVDREDVLTDGGDMREYTHLKSMRLLRSRTRERITRWYRGRACVEKVRESKIDARKSCCGEEDVDATERFSRRERSGADESESSPPSIAVYIHWRASLPTTFWMTSFKF